MNEKSSSKNIENDVYNQENYENDYTNLITRLKEINKNILLLQKEISK
tara:strand:+ start:302 stop:445 length:144 start_codon:yes stop_codon:yes gene_type:complete